MFSRPSLKKYGLGMVLTIFTFVTIFGSVAFVQPANAQATIAQIVGDVPRMTTELVAKIKEGFKVAVMNAAQKAVSYFLRKVAHDSAVWLASGGKGQSPFAHTNSFGAYMEETASDAFGTAIEALGQPFGLNLCGVPDIKIDLAIKIGLRGAYDEGGPTKPKCNWSNFKKGWGKDSWKSKYGSKDALQKQFNASLKADPDSDFGVYVKSTQKIDSIVSKKETDNLLQRQEGQGFKGLTSLISGDVKTPAQVQQQAMKANTPEEQNKKSEAQVGSALGSGTFQIIPSTLSLFLNTLASQMVKNFKEKGMLPFGACIGKYGGESCKDSPTAEYFEGEGVKIGGREAASAAFSEFLVATIKAQDSYDILSQLNNCPDAPGTYNCRADEQMVQAVQEAKYGNPVTVAEAIAKNWIHPDWKLLSDERPENLDTDCYTNAYCYANIKVLRQVGILSLGFEIAALNSDPDSPWTIGQVVAGFNDCNPSGRYDPTNFPFCHLIDPNWVLKVEPTRCSAMVNGSQPLMGGAPDRLEDCADLSSCVAYNKDGTCLSYGYCTRSKNLWRFDADKCDSFYNTCKAFTDANGNSAAYLYRTLDTNYCNQNTVGCTAYSLNKNNNGWLSPGVNINSRYYNNGINFNNKLSSSCSSGSEGCSAFKVASTTDVLYLRKAPDYLNCYDTDLTVDNIQWPQNNADLAKIQPKSDCSLYSGVCTPLEVGCNMFTSLLTGEQIPGKFKAAVRDPRDAAGSLIWNDQCSEKCNGYAAYREMPNNYSNGTSVTYIIPSSGNVCKAEDEGCSSFTNMGEVVAGGEKVEYYSYLRPCIKPDTTKQKNFYTYEGDKNGGGGYQLKSYTLEKDPATGAPKYWYRTASDEADYNNRCSETNYKAGLSDADCRQFNDESGNVYYRLLSKTIVVNDRCAYYRFNSPEFASSSGATYTCFQNGVYQGGFCYYNGLPSGVQTTAGASRTCSANAESCYAYKGNAGNNVKQIFTDGFEGKNITPASLGWSAGTDQLIISSESTHFGEHSLGQTGMTTLEKDISISSSSTLTIGRSYVLTFWAKGSRNNVGVSLNTGSGHNDSIGTFNVSDVWQYYSFSPVELTGSTTTAKLQFSGGTIVGPSANLFIDNVRLVEVVDYLYLVRKTLKVDPVCDSNLDDNLPGEALGCTGYTVPNNPQPFYLTNFSYLCRDGAVGCTAMFDTFNTPDNNKAEAYNVWFTGPEGTKTIAIDRQTFSCVIPTGEKGCYMNLTASSLDPLSFWNNIAAQNGVLTTSTIHVPADIPSSGEIAGVPSTSPIYLVANQEGSCNQADMGCTFAGLQTVGPSGVAQFTTVTIKNDPATYKENLCQAEAVGCNAYSLGQGTYYFKDPAVTGQKVCEYKSGVMVSGALSSGWFWKGVGTCSSGAKCQKDADCTSGVCNNIGQIACYPSYIQTGNNFGIWSFGDKERYQNFVGECPVEQSGCTEFVDNNDTGVATPDNPTPNGRAYYFINNDKIGPGDCDGLVSQKYGCALFDQTDKPGKLWDTAATYLLSEQGDSKKVEPKSDTPIKDANIILKVVRDRECGEWLQCQTSHRVWDEVNGKWKQVCDTFGRCDKAPATIQESTVANCAHFYNVDEYPLSNRLLRTVDYISRSTRWQDMDFTGYSILNLYPPEELKQININSTTPDWRLVKTLICGGNAAINNCPTTTAGVVVTSTVSCAREAAPCGLGGLGKCQNKVCIINPDGTTFTNTVDGDKLIKHECRGYPEKDSPFPNTTELGSNSSMFGSVNLCNEGRNGIGSNSQYLPASSKKDKDLAYGCDCNYTRTSYGDGAMDYFFNYETPSQLATDEVNKFVTGTTITGGSPTGICQLSNPPKVCMSDEECGGIAGSGMCLLKKKESKFLGWQGYCLERDVSRNLYNSKKSNPCLSWLPVNQLNGVADVDGQHTEAGYTSVYPYYCIKSDEVRGVGGSQYSVNTPESYENTEFVPGSFYREHIVPNDNGYVDYGIDTGDWDCKCDNGAAPVCENNYSPNYTIVGSDNYKGLCKKVGDDYQFIQPEAKCIEVGTETNPIVGGSPVCSGGGKATCMPKFSGRKPPTASIGGPVYYYGTSDDYVSDFEKPKYLPTCSDYGIFGFAKEAENALHISSGQGKLKFIPAGGNLANLHQYDIERVRFSVTEGDREDPDINQEVYVYPNQYIDGAPQSFSELNAKNDNLGSVVVGNYMGKHNLPAFFYGYGGNNDNNYGLKAHTGQFNYPAETDQSEDVVKGNLFALDSNRGLKLKDGTKVAGTLGMFDDVTYPEPNTFCPPKGNTGNWHGLTMEFDPVTKLFKGFYFFYCDDSDGSGSLGYIAYFDLRETCVQVADATSKPSDPNSAIAWTDRLWRSDRFKSLENTGFFYDQKVAPFGALGLVSLPFDPVYLTSKKLLPSQTLSNMEKSCDTQSSASCECKVASPGMCDFNHVKDQSDVVVGGLYSCSGSGKCGYTNGLNTEIPYPASVALNLGLSDLSSIFIKTRNGYKFDNTYADASTDYTRYMYTGYSDSDPGNLKYNNTEESSINKAPQVHPVDLKFCNNDGLCTEKNIPGITVNDKYNEDVKINTSPAQAAIRFYAYADKDQMPLRNITVDWGDGVVIPRSGFFRNARGVYDRSNNEFGCVQNPDASKPKYCRVKVPNVNFSGVLSSVWDDFFENTCSVESDCQSEFTYLPICRAGESGALDFGHIEGRTCDSNYFQFDHVYQCMIGSEYWKGGAECPDKTMQTNYGGCCVYKPRVQVKDNWGWYNGSCGNSNSLGGVGCYDHNDLSSKPYGYTGSWNDEGIANGAWTYFGGSQTSAINVLVAPR